ncbi:protein NONRESPONDING TO OXYLIPINS 2, mitochondrial-like isoform X2 [Typha angustifolia]|uniref:protein NONRESPONDING TO OXYLIPINS 2, mitochondrial-like isoform X2 n=1 Tax=Typha angustifolia TaxID=59011 RepID=UPI003C2B65B3
MASTGLRSLNRNAFSSIRSFLAKSKVPSPSPTSPQCSTSIAASRRFRSFSRLPVELAGCSGSLLPLHSAVAAARLTSCLSSSSRSCRALSQDGIDGT